ncbi:MAG: CdaR family protein [Desulfoprunum sp.]|nr:CdaR family protein [Desulfoprunum sp.]
MEKLDLQKIIRVRDKLLDSRNWQRLLSRSWFLKGLSLCLAVMLWYFVGSDDTVDKNVMIPIEIINLPRDLVISNQFKKEIEVTVSGPRSLILEMTNRAVTRQVDLSSATPGTMVISNANNSIPVPRGITVLRVQPSSVILSLDKLIQKHFPIKAVASGRIASGYILKKMKMDPEVITITGPQTILFQIDELQTQNINLEGLSESQQRQVPLKLSTEIVELIGETSVTASLQVVPEAVERKVHDIPVVAILDGVQQQVNPAEVTVTANIPKVLIKEKTDLKKLFTVTTTDVLGDGKMKVVIIPREDVKEQIEILAVEPDYVEIVKKNGKNSGQEKRIQPGDGQNGGGTSKSSKGSSGENVGLGEEKNQGKAAFILNDKMKIKTEKK